MPRVLGPLWLVTALGWAVGCGEAQPPEPEPGAAPTLSSSEIEELRAIGYLESAPGLADPENRGALVLDRERVDPGYRLYTAGTRCRAVLIDVDGNEVNSWSHQPCRRWMQAELLPSGDLLVPGSDPVEREKARDSSMARRYLMRLSWDGEVVWKAKIPAHHDMEETADGEILALTRHRRRDHSLGEGANLLDHAITRLSAEGQVLESISFYDLVRQNEIGFELQPVEPKGKHGRLDVFHSNSVESMRRPGLAAKHPLYSLDNVLVCLRHQDSIWMIDRQRRKLVWAWGRGELSGPHDAQVLENGNILIFDNGLERGWSRVVEMNPLSEEIVWTYAGEQGDRFFTRGRGSSQRLPNGNTLVSVSDEGEAFEVAPDGEVVWRFWNPQINDDGHREIIVRTVRYDPSPHMGR